MQSYIRQRITFIIILLLVFINTIGMGYSSYVYANNPNNSEPIKFRLSPYNANNSETSNENQNNRPLQEETDSAGLSSNEITEAASAKVSDDSATDTLPAAKGEVELNSLSTPDSDANVDINTEKVKETVLNNDTSAPLPGNTELGNTEPTNVASTPKLASPVLQGQAVYTVPSGTPIKLKLASVPSHPIKLMNRDLEGQLYPARLGQELTARTSEDIYVEKNKVIPEGTIFYGTVSKILPPRRVGRPGSLVISFDQLMTPDGRTFAFKIEADNHRASTAKTKAKGFGIIAYHAFGGAIVGALVAYQICGMHYTIAMHGYNIAAGAAAGALIATGYAIMRKGPQASLEPGDDLNMSIEQDLLMPAAVTVPEKKNISENLGLTMHVEKSKVVNDGLNEHFITVDMTATNEGEKELSSIDLFLEDTNKERHPISMSPDEDSQFLFHLEPHSTRHLHISFLTQYPKLKQKLVWLDHETKIVLASEKFQ